MAHLYDKAPPGFAKDPWAWDYTRDRIEQNTGIPYDQWQGKHFAGASAMYKNVVKKYQGSMQAGDLTLPKECIDCGEVKAHYNDDYICRDCREAIEVTDSYEAASKTISRPDALEDIRKQLYKSLGHDKKDAAKGRTAVVASGDTPGNNANDILLGVSDNAPAAPSGQVSRNYGAMGIIKLRKVISELENGTGDAVKRVNAKGESIDDHLEAAYRAEQSY